MHMNHNGLKPKVSIVGCGSVGMAYAYALMIRGSAREIILVDADRNRADGEAMDLSHGAPYVAAVEVRAGGYEDTAGSDLIVITAGKKQKPGQTRLDLVKDNVALFQSIVPALVQRSPDAILLVATNPVDILAYATWRISGKPAATVIGSGTVLDSARFRSSLAKHCNVDPHNIHAYILGEHGDTEFPLWSTAMIGSVLFRDYCMICHEYKDCRHQESLQKIFDDVKTAAYKIIERKGYTSYGIGLALVRITDALLNDENSVLPVSSLIRDYSGVDDVYLSIPAIINRKGIREILKVGLDAEEQQALQRSAATLKSIIAELPELRAYSAVE